MIGVREAVQKAIDYAVAILGQERAVHLLLEEVRSDVIQGRDVWLITLSMPRAEPLQQVLAGLLSVGVRDYKTFAINKDTGDFVEMTIRPVPVLTT